MVSIVFNSVENFGIRLAQQDKQLSFGEFAKENNFPVSVFENIKNSKTNSGMKNTDAIGEMLAYQRKLLRTNYERILLDYILYLRRKAILKYKRARVNLGISVARRQLRAEVMYEKQKLYSLIYQVKKKYGEKASKKMIQTAEAETESLYNAGKNAAWDIASEARELIYTTSVPNIFQITIPKMKNLVKYEKDKFYEILKDLKNGKNA